MAESTAVVLANVVKFMPPFNVENAVESDANDDCCVETTPDSEPDTEATPVCLAEIAVEIPLDSMTFTLCKSKTVVDSNMDADSTPLCRANTAAEMPEEITVESLSCRAVSMMARDVEMESTSLFLADTVVEIPAESDASLLRVAEMKLCNTVDTEAIELEHASVAVEIPEDRMMSRACNMEAATDNDVDTDATSLILAEMLDVNDISVEAIVLYSCGPDCSAAAISNSVSNDEGAAPTSDVIAVST